ncbi:MAG TPA: ABC transporter ATP-binding protein [Thermohalobaculum sp.]|nr:ABC transporter ATP-binding protein [Thermohalobaculum sp.]
MSIRSNAASVVFEGVSKIYAGTVRAVDNISLKVEPGELVTLLGPSGCGKTTTLRMIAGLERATEGRILIGGEDVTGLSATDRDVSMVFQSYALFPHMTVMENVAYGLESARAPKAEVAEKARGGLDLVGLSGYGDRFPSELSGGQQQRVAVARALVLEPQVLLFDEPLSNLDARLRRRVRDEIRDIQTKLGLTVVYVTHDQEEALAVSDRIIVMNNAVIAQIGTPRELYDSPADAFVADFIGEANLIPCEVVGVSGGRAEVRAGPLSRDFDARGLSPGPARIAVRPGRISLAAHGTPGSIPAALIKQTYVGSRMEYQVATDLGEIFVTSEDVGAGFDVGAEVGLILAATGPVLVAIAPGGST